MLNSKMGLFNRSKKEEQKYSLSELPKLPTLPRLENKDFSSTDSIPQLPSLPSSSFGERFSQNAIKDAVSGFSGEKGDDEEGADESGYETRMMHEPPRKSLIHEEGKRMTDGKRNEPVFVRIDKFEESIDIFEKAERKISEMEELFSDIRKIKEEEEKELESWENKIQSVKRHIEKIDQEIFSKIE
ncbi:MAG: hypothetical protein OQK82_06620 [Candidatus Pacearchaeota archaeon]|nr:hypothetical protein [Candidatus Pacearchaeota archaeon]